MRSGEREGVGGERERERKQRKLRLEIRHGAFVGTLTFTESGPE